MYDFSSLLIDEKDATNGAKDSAKDDAKRTRVYSTSEEEGYRACENGPQSRWSKPVNGDNGTAD